MFWLNRSHVSSTYSSSEPFYYPPSSAFLFLSVKFSLSAKLSEWINGINTSPGFQRCPSHLFYGSLIHLLANSSASESWKTTSRTSFTVILRLSKMIEGRDMTAVFKCDSCDVLCVRQWSRGHQVCTIWSLKPRAAQAHTGYFMCFLGLFKAFNDRG